jgi:hypothetical protein
VELRRAHQPADPLLRQGDDGRWFTKAADQSDPVWGAYLDNTEIAQVIFQVLQGR